MSDKSRGDWWADKAAELEGERNEWMDYAKALKAENESLRKDAELIAEARDLYRGDAIVHAGKVVRLEHEIQVLRKALRTIRDESEDLGASECAADALIDAAISSPENHS